MINIKHASKVIRTRSAKFQESCTPTMLLWLVLVLWLRSEILTMKRTPTSGMVLCYTASYKFSVTFFVPGSNTLI